MLLKFTRINYLNVLSGTLISFRVEGASYIVQTNLGKFFIRQCASIFLKHSLGCSKRKADPRDLSMLY